MAEHHSHDPEGPSEEELKDSIAAGYERNDVSIPALLKWGFVLVVFLVATSAAGLILYALLQHPPFKPEPASESFVRSQTIIPPTGTPILQDNPAGDPRADNNVRKGIDSIREFRHDEEIRINEYATQDGNIHIPIDRAMELSVKNFPAQMPGEAPTGVSPTPEMKIHPRTSDNAPEGAPENTSAPVARP